MPLLGAIGNASEYSFRGTYDNYPFDIDFGDLVDAEPGQIYTTLLKLVEDINYKVPISISGDGEYFVGNIIFNKTFDSDVITFDQTATTFGSTFPKLDYTNEPSYVRNGNTVALRIFGIPPKNLTNLDVIDRSANSYNVPLSNDITLSLRSDDVTFSPNGSVQVDDRTFQGFEVGIEYYDKTYTTTITIGKKDFTWTVQTIAGGTAENFAFPDATDVNFSTEIISDVYTVSGLTDVLNYNIEVTSSEGSLSVNYGDFVTSSSIKNGDIIRLRLISSDLNFTQKTVAARIFLSTSPNIQSTTSWNVRTLDNIPSNLSFTDITAAELSSEILSNVVSIQGLSNNIDFNVSITSTDGLLSINGDNFVKSATIRNGDSLQLKVSTTSTWLQEKTITIQLENTSTNWKVTNRTISANIDSNADKLIYAIPFNTINQIQDMSPEVRIKNSLSQGFRSSSNIPTIAGRVKPSISTERSRYYGNIGSYKQVKGTTTKTFEVSALSITTDQTQILGYSDFTIELWMWASGFGFGGEVGMSIFYPSYINNKNSNDYFFQLFLKGDNWGDPSSKQGLLLGYPDSNGVVQTICQTSQVLAVNSWNHIALTRSGNTFRIWVNGVLQASGTRSMDLTSKVYNFGIPNSQRLINEDNYIQDLRLYKGLVKYTSNFNPLNVTPIMETYIP